MNCKSIYQTALKPVVLDIISDSDIEDTISLVTRLSKSVVSQYIDLLPADY